MNAPDPDLAAIRTRLLADKARLQEARKESAGARAPVELDQTSVGRLSRVDAIQHQAMALAAERRRAGTLQRIDQALARIDASTYGICVGCGEEIAPKRLGLDPAIATCLECASGPRG